MTLCKMKKLVLAAAAVCCMFVLASCGARVDTKFTADADFKGTRIITVTLGSGDLKEYVPGGKESIEAVIKKYMPSCMTYTLTAGTENLVAEFKIPFSGYDDYKSKVETILAAEKDDPVTPEMEYESVGSPFKSSLRFNEEFSSMDLIGWLRYGLKQEDAVTESDTSNWFENGSTSAEIAGESYSVYNEISVDDSVYNTPESIRVNTYFLTSGNFDRDIIFKFSDDVLTKLSEQGVNVEEHFKSLSTAATVEKTSEDNRTTYTVSMSGLTAQLIAAETAKVLQCDPSIFEVSVTPDVNVDRRMLINVNEKMDGLYYLRNERYLESAYFLYEGVQVSDTSEIGMSRTYDEDENYGFSYTPSYVEAESAKSTYVWDLTFDTAGLELDFSGENVDLDVKLSVAADMLASAKQILGDAVTRALPEGTEAVSEDADGMTVYTVDFGTKNAEEEASAYREFVYNYTGNKVECEFEVQDGVSTSPFKTLKVYTAKVDMGGLGDDQSEFRFKNSGSVYVLENSNVISYSQLASELSKAVSDTEDPELRAEKTAEAEKIRARADDTADYAGVFNGTLRFYAIEEKVNAAAYIFVIGLGISALAAVIFIAVNAKTWIAAAKGAAASMPKPQFTAPAAASSESTGNTDTAPAAAPQASESDDDEEEFV